MAVRRGPLKLVGRPIEILIIPLNIRFLLVDDAAKEFEDIRNRFCTQTNCPTHHWFRTINNEEADSYCARLSPCEKVVLITTGRLSENMVTFLHQKHSKKLHSLYIYCNNTEKYKGLANNLNKLAPVVGVFNNPEMLIIRLKENLVIESRKISEEDIPNTDFVIPHAPSANVTTQGL